VAKGKTFNPSFGGRLTPEGKEQRRLPEDGDPNCGRKQGEVRGEVVMGTGMITELLQSLGKWYIGCP